MILSGSVQSSTNQQAEYINNKKMYFISDSFYEFARDGVFSFIINGIFGSRLNKPPVLVGQPLSLLELHLAQAPANMVNIVNIVNIGAWRRQG